MRTIALACLVLLTASACVTSVRLTPKAKAVRIMPAHGVADCRFVKLLVSEHGGNGRSRKHNVQLTVSETRNLAAAEGADTVVLGALEDDDNNTLAQLTGSKCTNCVRLTSQAYDCGGATPASSAEPKTADSGPPTKRVARARPVPPHCGVDLKPCGNKCIAWGQRCATRQHRTPAEYTRGDDHRTLLGYDADPCDRERKLAKLERREARCAFEGGLLMVQVTRPSIEHADAEYFSAIIMRDGRVLLRQAWDAKVPRPTGRLSSSAWSNGLAVPLPAGLLPPFDVDVVDRLAVESFSFTLSAEGVIAKPAVPRETQPDQP